MKTFEITLDMSIVGMVYAGTVCEKDYNAYSIVAKINNRGKEIVLGDYYDIVVTFKREDSVTGIISLKSGQVFIKDNRLWFILPNSAYSINGETIFQVQMYKQDKRMTFTNRFTVNVLSTICENGEIDKDDRFPILDGMLTNMINLEQKTMQLEQTILVAQNNATSQIYKGNETGENIYIKDGIKDGLLSLKITGNNEGLTHFDNLHIRNKNLLSENELNKVGTIGGDNLVVDQDKYILLDYLVNAEVYTLSYESQAGQIVVVVDGNTYAISNKTITFVAGNENKVMFFAGEYVNIMLEKGNEKSDFLEGNYSKVLLDLNLYSCKGVKDEADINSGFITKKIEMFNFNTELSWSVSENENIITATAKINIDFKENGKHSDNVVLSKQGSDIFITLEFEKTSEYTNIHEYVKALGQFLYEKDKQEIVSFSSGKINTFDLQTNLYITNSGFLQANYAKITLATQEIENSIENSNYLNANFSKISHIHDYVSIKNGEVNSNVNFTGQCKIKGIDIANKNEIDSKLNLTGGNISGNLNIVGALTKGSKSVATYESGTCLLGVGSGLGYTNRTSTYTIIGNICTVKFNFLFNGIKPTVNADLIFSGLPVAPAENRSEMSYVFVSNFGTSPTPSPYMCGIRRSDKTFTLRYSDGVSRYARLATTAHINSDCLLCGEMSYEI